VIGISAHHRDFCVSITRKALFNFFGLCLLRKGTTIEPEKRAGFREPSLRKSYNGNPAPNELRRVELPERIVSRGAQPEPMQRNAVPGYYGTETAEL
jgi:hypothetical protein